MIEELIWVLVPLAGIAIGGLAIYLDHQKKMKMLEKGIKDNEKKKEKEDMISGGLVMIGIGAAFLISGFIIWTDMIKEYGLIGLICLFIGFALVISYHVKKK